jgi:hypothetical protein
MEAAAGIIAIALAGAVYLDARRIGVKPNLLPGILRWGPTGWAAWSFFLGIVAVPFYAFHARPRYVGAIRAAPERAAVPWPSRRFAILAGVGVALLIVVVAAAAMRPRPVGASQGLRWWRFTVECLRRENVYLVLASDRSTAIARKCRHECSTFEGTPTYQRCDRECSSGWQRGRGSGDAWPHEASCRYGVEREDWP